MPWLSRPAVAYPNIDFGVAGPDPGLSATLDLHRVAIDTMKKVVYDNQQRYSDLTLYDVWYGSTNGIIGVVDLTVITLLLCIAISRVLMWIPMADLLMQFTITTQNTTPIIGWPPSATLATILTRSCATSIAVGLQSRNMGDRTIGCLYSCCSDASPPS